uniref:Uncharacterized protein n=1 Tax=Anopheles atroparvus TaxID=41427 RepID=A0AAG5DTW1_ANOAO
MGASSMAAPVSCVPLPGSAPIPSPAPMNTVVQPASPPARLPPPSDELPFSCSSRAYS